MNIGRNDMDSCESRKSYAVIPKIWFGAVFLFIGILGFLLYAPSLRAPFQLDSILKIRDHAGVRDVTDLARIWAWDPSRFLSHLSFAFNYHTGGLDPFGYHIVNGSLHILMSFLVFVFCLKIYSKLLRDTSSNNTKKFLFASLAALLFLVHPIQTSTVTYIVQRSTILASVFYLMTILLYGRYREGGSVFFYVCSWLTAFAGVFCKPIMMTLPFAVFLYDVVFIQQSLKIRLKHIVRIAPYLFIVLLIPVLLILWRHGTFSLAQIAGITKETELISRQHYLLTQFNVVMTYIRLLFLPINQNLDYAYPIATSFFTFPTWLSFIGIMVLLSIAFRILKKEKIIAFGMLWFFVTLSLESSIFPINDVIFEHRLYLPMVGFVVIIPVLLDKWLGKKVGWIAFVAVVILMIFSVLTIMRNHLWSNRMALLKDIAKKSPNKARVHINLGRGYEYQGDVRNAIKEYSLAIKLDPHFDTAYINRAARLEQIGMLKEALLDVNKAIELNPQSAPAFNNRGVIFEKLGNIDMAYRDFCQAIDLNPKYIKAYTNRGEIFRLKGQYDLALQDYDKVIEINPDYFEVYNNRGILYKTMGETDLAIEDYNRVIEKKESANAYNNRGIAYKEKGDYEYAIRDYNMAIAINPRNAESYANRGIAYERLRNYEEALRDFNKALEIKPSLMQLLINRANANMQLKNYDEVIVDLDRLIEAKPKEGKLYLFRSQTYKAMAIPHKSIADALKAQELGEEVEENYLYELECLLNDEPICPIPIK